MRTSGIYVIRLILDGRCYVGSSINIEKRWRTHKMQLFDKTHHCRYLQRSWDKYGAVNFQFIIVDRCDPESLIKREQMFFNLLVNKFNCSPVAGSTLGVRHSEEVRRKSSLRRRQPIKHGTVKGYQQELKRGLKSCHECREAQRRKSWDQRRSDGIPILGSPEYVLQNKIRGLKSIGRKHSREACEKIRASKLKPIAHGTRNGYRQEIGRGLAPCELCRAAVRLYSRMYDKNNKNRRKKYESIATSN